jgi:hypothetical protein
MEIVQPNTKVMILDPGQGRWKTWDVLPGRMTGPDADPDHMTVLVAALSEKGSVFWNEWRTAHPVRPAKPGQHRIPGGEHPAWANWVSTCPGMTCPARL